MTMILAALAAAATPACPRTAPGKPVWVAIERIKDGDTFQGLCRDRFGFPEVYRLLDLDTPEKAPLAKCREEAEHAKKASAFVADMAASAGMRVRVTVAPHKEKYGRYLASARFRIGTSWFDWREVLIEHGYALAYDGGRKADWCAILRGPENLLPPAMQ